MSFYGEIQKIALGVLKEFNQGVISYLKITPGNGPVDDPGLGYTTSYLLEGAAARGVEFRYIRNNLALASDSQIVMSVDARFTPNILDFVEKDGVRYKIIQVIKKPDAGEVVAYVLIVRKA
jgi:hypothetical protein